MRKTLAALRRLAAAAALLLPIALQAAETSGGGLTLGPADGNNVLVVHASNSVQVFRGVLEDFSRLNPANRLEYTEAVDADLVCADRGARVAIARRQIGDIVISSGMDLQTKLVNDGARRPTSA